MVNNGAVFRVEVDQRIPQEFDTSGTYPWAVFQRPQVLDVESHRKPVGFNFFGKASDIAQAVEAEGPVVDSRVRHKTDAVAGEQDTTKVFAIVVSQQADIPWSRGLGQLPADEPGSGLHIDVLSHLAQQPFHRRQITPESGWSKARAVRPVHEVRPGRREKCP